ncbi:T9SS type A sorting domain-containing protein [Hymenobacter sp. BT523]|uniref:T9SS type A sorting domain-containing protein n=1 Tax=Hymenobacter sp. BT523 TaxID=2795725 RepID=UPI0018ED2CB4|nr:T9SS type A sorting domain-containing protein [Hymenobacter sp. BT523]MBJ6111057.1 T9SS type A sorting domain-containing protein [Hymenobacter sp. BT523]
MNTPLHARRRGPLGWALLLLTALLFNRPTQAQTVDTYTLAASAGTFTPLPATATAVTTISTDDAITGAIPLGFSFVFDGVTYTQVYANSNGWISFNASAPANGTAAYSNALATVSAASRPMVAPYWDDLDGVNGTASYQTTGTAGSRVFTFQWLNWRQHSATAAPQLSFQVQLVEGTNLVRFVYRPEPAAITSTASIGLAGAGTGSGSFLSLNNTSTTPAASSTTETSNIATAPAAGQTYTFTPAAPAACPAPRNLAATVTSNSAVLTYSVTNTPAGPFTILYGPTGFNPALPASATNVYSTATATGTTFTITGLTPLTGYQFYIVQNCGGTAGSSTRSNAGSFTTAAVAPANDDCAGAINIPVQFGGCTAPTMGNNTAATASTGAPAPTNCTTGGGTAEYQGGDIWFKVTVPATGTVTLETSGTGGPVTDTGMAVYSGTCTTLNQIECDDDDSQNGLFSLIALTGRTPGEVLYVRVWEYGNDTFGPIGVCATSPSNCAVPTGPTASNLTNTTAQLTWVAPAGTPGTYDVEYGPQGFTPGTGTTVANISGTTTTLTGLTPSTAYCFYVRQNCGSTNGSSTFVGPICFTTPLTAPANDEPCGAITLGTTTITGSNVGATTSLQNGINVPACAPAAVPKDVWYAFTATAATRAMTVTGTAAGSVRVYTSPSCSAGPFTQVFCQAGPGNNQNVGPINITGLTVGTRYYVAISGYGSSDTPGTFTIAGTPTATRAQADTEALLVYPNPSSTGQLTLRLSGPTGLGQATLLNALGQTVRTQALNGTAEQTLSTRHLAAGLYTLRVTVGEQVLTRKVVLE